MTEMTVSKVIKQGGEVMLITYYAYGNSAYTLDMTTTANGGIASGDFWGVVAAWDITGSDAVTCTNAKNVLTIDAAGGTTAHYYVITCLVRGK